MGQREGTSIYREDEGRRECSFKNRKQGEASGNEVRSARKNLKSFPVLLSYMNDTMDELHQIVNGKMK